MLDFNPIEAIPPDTQRNPISAKTPVITRATIRPSPYRRYKDSAFTVPIGDIL
jgi:hypothetical protein